MGLGKWAWASGLAGKVATGLRHGGGPWTVMVAIEIERKFLVTGDGWRGSAGVKRIQQGYLPVTGDVSVRIRLQDGAATLAVKGERSGISREEYEYSVPLGDAENMLRLCPHQPIVKLRHEIMHGGKLWQVDEFDGRHAGLVIAEIELADVAEAFERPSWLGVEVSEDPRYRNSVLARSGIPIEGEVLPLRRPITTAILETSRQRKAR